MRGRKYSADVPQGGLEIPSKLRFEALGDELQKAKKTYRQNTLEHFCFKFREEESILLMYPKEVWKYSRCQKNVPVPYS